MLEALDKSTVVQRLAYLDRRDPRRKIFGANGHDYKLRPTVPISVIESFEKQHGISLPANYRSFITEIGDGGAGPFYGLLPFGKDDDDHDWESGGLVGDVSKPFTHTGTWNLPESFWNGEPDPAPDTLREEEDRLWEAWDRELEALPPPRLRHPADGERPGHWAHRPRQDERGARGYEDCRASGVLRQRQRWIEGGGQWWKPSEQPRGWNFENQVEQIPSDIPQGIDRDVNGF